MRRKESNQTNKQNKQTNGIFCQFRSKLAITHTVAIKWKEKYYAVVEDCNHTCICVVTAKKKTKKNFLGRLLLLPGSHLLRNFDPLCNYFALVTPAYSL